MISNILGIDLGSASIGWALITEDSDNNSASPKIIDLGCRIIPYDGTEGQDFAKGTGESKNAIRTSYRSARRGYDRYQLRRSFLVKILTKHNMMPSESLKNLPKLELWELRAKAVKEEVSLPELGRLLLWLNQKRGYKSSRSDSNLDKKDTEYVASVKSRHEVIRGLDYSIGQYFYNQLSQNEYYRIKENVFPREAYIEEYNSICSAQQKFHPEITDELIAKIRDEIIYYQRPLKSQKGLVATCEFEGFTVTKDGKEYFTGPKVAHKSSPIFQIAKIWESINNVRIKTKYGDELQLTVDQKREIFEYLDTNEKLTFKNLCKIIGKKEDELFVDRKLFNTGLQGNLTKCTIIKCFENKELLNHLLTLKVIINEKKDKQVYLFNRTTGEILDHSDNTVKIVDRGVEYEPFYRLWHTIYSISDIEICTQALIKNFKIDPETANKLALLDFNKKGYSNKSVKALRKILPYLIEGYCYSDAMAYAGYNHSGSLTKDENLSRHLLDQLKPISKNSLRQPVVEKILNQMINLVNEVIKQHGKPDEIRVELARELKQSKDERNDAELFLRKRTRENETIAKELEEFGLRATRNNIIKWRLYNEIDNQEKKLNATCIYCGKNISLTEAIKGHEVDIEHIIPKSKLFDDSQSNKTLAHRRCNSTKGNMTAHDFMQAKPDADFQAYIERVNTLFDKKVISKTKRDKLLMSEENIPDNFIDRQLRETQYISKKAKEILSTVCHKVWCTSGMVTAELRHLWGWEDVTMNLQLPKYRDIGLTDVTTWESNHGNSIHEKEKIVGWTKRDDHRHHAVDALTIACTKQGFIQRLNTLSSQKTREELNKEVSNFETNYKEKLSTLEKYLISKKPFSVKDVENAVSQILISFKAGKKVITTGTRKVGSRGNKKVVQRGIIIPRGALSEESVYGKIKVLEKEKPLKYLFENPQLIVKEYIKKHVESKLKEFNNDVKRAYSNTRKNPIFLDNEKTIPLEHASCYKEEFVIKYPVNGDFNKADKVVDESLKHVLKTRLEKFNNNPKEAFKDVAIEDNGAIKWYDHEGLSSPIHSVRCLTGLSAVVPARKDQDGNDIGYVKPGNNHHVAIYYDSEEKLVEHVCTFWHAVERRKYGIPAVINDTDLLWGLLQQNSNQMPESFLEQLPAPGLKLKLSLQQNEMFILGLPQEEILSLLESKDYRFLSNYLYRVQKIRSSDYYFRHHLETQLDDSNESKIAKRFYRICSINALNTINPFKIRINLLGNPIY